MSKTSQHCPIKTNSKTCNKRKKPHFPICLTHLKLLPLDIQDELLFGFNEDKHGRKYLNTFKKCMKIWRENEH